MNCRRYNYNQRYDYFLLLQFNELDESTLVVFRILLSLIRTTNCAIMCIKKRHMSGVDWRKNENDKELFLCVFSNPYIFSKCFLFQIKFCLRKLISNLIKHFKKIYIYFSLMWLFLRTAKHLKKSTALS